MGSDKKIRGSLRNVLHCKVTLCVSCFVTFHTITHLSNRKIILVISSSVQENNEDQREGVGSFKVLYGFGVLL